MAVHELEAMTRYKAPPEPPCSFGSCTKPMLGYCQACSRPLCHEHVANLDMVLEVNDWPACIHHVELVSRANINRWSQQWANFKMF